VKDLFAYSRIDEQPSLDSAVIEDGRFLPPHAQPSCCFPCGQSESLRARAPQYSSIEDHSFEPTADLEDFKSIYLEAPRGALYPSILAIKDLFFARTRRACSSHGNPLLKSGPSFISCVRPFYFFLAERTPRQVLSPITNPLAPLSRSPAIKPSPISWICALARFSGYSSSGPHASPPDSR